MIKYIKYYYFWSNKSFQNEAEANERLRVTKESRMGTIFFGYFNLLISVCIWFCPFPVLSKAIVSAALFGFYVLIIIRCDFSFIKILRLYILSKKREKSIYTKIVYDHYFKNISSKFTSLFNSRGIYKFKLEYSSSFKILFTIVFKEAIFKCIFKTNRVVLKYKKIKKTISNKYQNENDLFNDILKLLNKYKQDDSA